jgi:hypothetical protein
MIGVSALNQGPNSHEDAEQNKKHDYLEKQIHGPPPVRSVVICVQKRP